MKPESRLRLSRAHRLLGLFVTVPLVGWVVSSFVLHGVGLALPNGLQGQYELKPYHHAAIRMEGAGLVAPSEIMGALRGDGIVRIYWLRLETLAGVPAYIVKPGPFAIERVYDARTGERMDPLSPALLRGIADGELVGTASGAMRSVAEFNRYYAVERVAAVSLSMEGEQPSDLVLSTASGRVLRRTDPLAAWFDRVYRSVHVWQWGDSLRLFTTLLFGLVGAALLLVSLGFVLWFDRRGARSRWSAHVRSARRLHAKLAPLAGVIVSTQMVVGAYLWFNLGLIEPRFRGHGSFRDDWSGGIATEESLGSVEDIAAAMGAVDASGAHPIQRYEWRPVGRSRLWLAYTGRDTSPLIFDAATGARLDRLTPDQAQLSAEAVVAGESTGPPDESTEYWMDSNARVPTYRFRFTDPDDSDVHVSQMTGEVIQRRPAIWRAFGPFLAYHTFGFTGNPWVDTMLLAALQITVLVMVVSGWRLALTRRTSRDGSPETGADE